MKGSWHNFPNFWAQVREWLCAMSILAPQNIQFVSTISFFDTGNRRTFSTDYYVRSCHDFRGITHIGTSINSASSLTGVKDAVNHRIWTTILHKIFYLRRVYKIVVNERKHIFRFYLHFVSSGFLIQLLKFLFWVAG